MKTTYQRLAILFIASAILTLAGTSCRTVRGLGQDVQHAGNHIEGAARH
jgi:predicted small secreted protein